MVVKFKSDHRGREAVDAPIGGGVEDRMRREAIEDFSVFCDERRSVILYDEDHARIEQFRGDEERDDDFVDLVEDVAGESAGGEDHGGDAVPVIADRRRSVAAVDDLHRSHFSQENFVLLPRVGTERRLLRGTVGGD